MEWAQTAWIVGGVVAVAVIFVIAARVWRARRLRRRADRLASNLVLGIAGPVKDLKP